MIIIETYVISYKFMGFLENHCILWLLTLCWNYVKIMFETKMSFKLDTSSKCVVLSLHLFSTRDYLTFYGIFFKSDHGFWAYICFFAHDCLTFYGIFYKLDHGFWVYLCFYQMVVLLSMVYSLTESNDVYGPRSSLHHTGIVVAIMLLSKFS